MTNAHAINSLFQSFEVGIVFYDMNSGEYISGTSYFDRITRELSRGKKALSYHDLSKHLSSEGDTVFLQTKLGKFQLEEAKSEFGDVMCRMIHLKRVPDLRQLFEDAASQMSEVFVHRLRSPLTGVKGFAEIVHNQNTNPDIESEIEFIEKGITEVTGLLDLAMELSDPIESSVTDVSTQHLCNDILNNFSVFDRRKITVHLKAITLHCDAKLIESIASALLKNALEASKEIPDNIEFTISEQQISVQNFGNPVPKKHIKKLFTPFFTTKARGMGLGLFLSQKYARSFGAKIELTSNSKKAGVVFTVQLAS